MLCVLCDEWRRGRFAPSHGHHYDCGNCRKRFPERAMQVRDGMSDVVLTVGPGHTLREAAALMTERQVGAAVVLDPDAPGPGVITERDILVSVASGEEPDEERVSGHLTSQLTFAAPDWSLEQAAMAMVRGRFRHLVVVEGAELVGMRPMGDIVRSWAAD